MLNVTRLPRPYWSSVPLLSSLPLLPGSSLCYPLSRLEGCSCYCYCYLLLLVLLLLLLLQLLLQLLQLQQQQLQLPPSVGNEF